MKTLSVPTWNFRSSGIASTTCLVIKSHPRFLACMVIVFCSHAVSPLQMPVLAMVLCCVGVGYGGIMG